VSVYAGTRGHLDDVPVADVRRFENELLEYVRTRHGDLLEKVRSTGALPDADALEGPISSFKEQFGPSGGDGGPATPAGGDAPRTDAGTGDAEDASDAGAGASVAEAREG
jgi:hypothetical protein